MISPQTRPRIPPLSPPYSDNSQYQNLEDNNQGGYGQYNPYGAQQNPYGAQQQQQPQQGYGHGGGYGQAGAMEQGNGGYGKNSDLASPSGAFGTRRADSFFSF